MEADRANDDDDDALMSDENDSQSVDDAANTEDSLRASPSEEAVPGAEAADLARGAGYEGDAGHDGASGAGGVSARDGGSGDDVPSQCERPSSDERFDAVRVTADIEIPRSPVAPLLPTPAALRVSLAPFCPYSNRLHRLPARGNTGETLEGSGGAGLLGRLWMCTRGMAAGM